MSYLSLGNGDNPKGFTWHHNAEPKLLQFVNEHMHANIGHDGGRVLWCGRSEKR
ncbi:HNH endonuclease [Niallia taxi]|uniref:HNH endonuclease n=1 Tax=Niallia taxi TaxID=2499688 RepID=UPI003CCC829A